MTKQEANTVADIKLVDFPYVDGNTNVAKAILSERYGEELSEDTITQLVDEIIKFQNTLKYDKTLVDIDALPANRTSYVRDDQGFVYKRVGNQLWRASSLKGTYVEVDVNKEGMDLLFRSFRLLLPEEEAIINE